ncbi:MAG TPA: thermonuclease family protein, partial [Candidatus Limnocylindrales bacterium]|nr:thermonuclease family protein [Candidatus Limnocylindrales bacterium]
MSQSCLRCGADRVGADDFCSTCGFQFAAIEPMAPTSPSIRGRISGRRTVAVAAAVIFGAALLGNLGRSTALTPDGVPSTSRPSVPVAAGAASEAATPWATIKPALAPTGPVQKAKVVRIVDGDTIVVALGGKNVKVRYIGMDTPEVVDPNSPIEPLGPQAAAANKKLVAGKTVFLEKDVSETDRYGRLLRYVWLQNGSSWTLVNLELVRLGLAQALSYPPDVKYDDVLAAAEGTARTSLVGLWGPAASATPDPTPKPTPRPTPKPTKKPSNCHPSYSPCLPIVADLDCPDVRAMGLAPVRVIGPDDYRLDRDH